MCWLAYALAVADTAAYFNAYDTTNSGNTRPGWSYDNAGNLLSVNGNTASYDAENRMKALSATVGGGAETLSYDGLGRRVQKAISGGSTTTYVYDAFGLAAEYVGGSWAKDYVKEGGGQLIATENAAGPCTTCYFTTDHLGSGRAIIDQNANVVTRHDYLPYGEEIVTSTAGRDANFGSTTDITQKFTGQVRDQESGVDYFNARYYTPALGRFNSVDPGNAGANFLSSQSWNGYGYVLGNPLSGVDPSGMTDITPGQVLGCKGAFSEDPWCNGGGSGSGGGAAQLINDAGNSLWGGPSGGSSIPIPGVPDWLDMPGPFGPVGGSLPCDFGACNGFTDPAILQRLRLIRGSGTYTSTNIPGMGI